MLQPLDHATRTKNRVLQWQGRWLRIYSDRSLIMATWQAHLRPSHGAIAFCRFSWYPAICHADYPFSLGVIALPALSRASKKICPRTVLHTGSTGRLTVFYKYLI